MDIATLGLAVDSRPVTAAAKALDTLADAGKRAETSTRATERAAKDAGDEQDALAASISRTTVAITAAVAGAGLLVKGYIQVADSVTELNNKLKLATGSTEAAAKASAGLYEIAQRSRVNFIELGGTYASIARNAGEMGIAQSRVLKVTESIANAMTISGGSAASMNAALVQLGQGMSSGVLRGEELNSVMEQAPRLAKALADGLGIPIGRLREMGAAGEITAQQVVKALESQSAVLASEVSGATMTVAKSFTQLTNASTRAIGEFDAASGSSAALAAAISAGAGAVDTLGTAFKNNQGVIQTVMGAIAGGAVLATLGAIPGAITAVTTALTGLAVVLAANPVVLALLGVGAVVGGGIAAVNAMAKTDSGIKDAIRSLQAENERSEAAMDRAIAGGRTGGADNISKAIEERKKAIRELNAELALRDNAGASNPAEDARFAASAAAKKADEAASRELLGIRQKLYKVDADYLPTLQKLHKQYTDGRITLAEYRADVELLAKANYKAATGAKGGTSQAVKDEIEAFKTMDAARKGYEKTMADGLKREIAAYEDYAKARDASEKKTLEGYQKSAEAAAQRAQGLEDEATAAALAAASNVSLGVAVEQVGLARAREAQAKALSNGADGATLLALQKEITAREKIIGLLTDKEGRSAAEKAAKDAAAGWERASNKIESDITGALMRGFEAGKGFIENLRDTAVNIFKSMVLEPTIRGIVSPVTSAAQSALGGVGNSLGSIGGLAGMGGSFGAGLKAGFSALTGEAGLMGAFSAGTTAIGAGNILGGLGTLAGSLGPIAIGVGAILSALKGGEYVQSLGESVATVTAARLVSLGGSGGTNDVSIGGGLNIRQTETSDKFVSGLASAFVKAASALGVTGNASFGFGSNNSDGGKFGITSTVGGQTYKTGDIKTSDAALQLEASRAVFFALQSSELPGYLRAVFDGLTATTASQADIDATISYANALKQIRESLLETREPLQILKDNVAEGMRVLGTTAETFKADFVAAIDAGITPDKLAQYQGLGSALEQLAKSSATATEAVVNASAALDESARVRGIVARDQAEGSGVTDELLRTLGVVSAASRRLMLDGTLPMEQSALIATGASPAKGGTYEYLFQDLGMTAAQIKASGEAQAAQINTQWEEWRNKQNVDGTMGDDNARYAAMMTGGMATLADNTKQLNDTLQQTNDSLKEYLFSLDATDAGIASPEQQLAATRKAFEESATVANAKAFLSNSKSYNASGQGYVQDEALVRSSLQAQIAMNNARMRGPEPEMSTAIADLTTQIEELKSVNKAQLAVAQDAGSQTVELLTEGNSQREANANTAMFEALRYV